MVAAELGLLLTTTVLSLHVCPGSSNFDVSMIAPRQVVTESYKKVPSCSKYENRIALGSRFSGAAERARSTG